MKARLPKGYGRPDPQAMMRQVQKMQDEIRAKQDELEAREYTGTASGEMVTVTMTGKHEVTAIKMYNMPLRALAKMTNGMVSMGMVDGLVWELKGFWLVGILRVIYEFVKNLILNSQMENRLKNS